MVIESLTKQFVLAPGERYQLSFQPGVQQVILEVGSPTRSPTTSEDVVSWSVMLAEYGSTAAVAIQHCNSNKDSARIVYPATPPLRMTPLHGWVCTIANEGGVEISLHLSLNSLATELVSFDVTLVNLMLAEALKIAQVMVHIESSDQGSLSYVHWSDAITNFLKGKPGWNGETGVDFHVDNTAHYAVVIPSLSIRSLAVTADDLGPCLQAVIQADSDGTLTAATLPNITLRSCTITVRAGVAGGQLSASCDVVTNAVDLHLTSIDQLVASQIVAALNQKLWAYTVAARHGLTDFFARLLRLEPEQSALSYSIDGTTLTMKITSPPTLPAKPVTAEASV